MTAHAQAPASPPPLRSPARNLQSGQPSAAISFKPVIRKRWVALFGLFLLIVAGVALSMISARVGAIDSTLGSFSADRVLGEATKATQRLRLAAMRPDGAAAMQQDLQLLSAMARDDFRSPLPGYKLEGAEIQALRALLPPALEALQAPRPGLAASERADEVLLALQTQIEALRAASDLAVARGGQRLGSTRFVPMVIPLLLPTSLVALLCFFLLMLRRAAEAHAAQLKLSRWADDAARLVGAMPGVLIRTNKNAKGIWVRSFVGDAVTHLTGHSPQEALTHGWLRDNIPSEDQPPLFLALDRALAGEACGETIRFRHKDGRNMWLRLLLSRHEDVHGKPEVLSLWSDVTREHELAQHLAHTGKLAHIGELMSNLAHELNQPLTSISLAAENAARIAARPEPDMARLTAKLEVVTDMASRASDLVERLRNFTRHDEHPKIPLKVAEVIGTARDVMGNRLRLLGISVLTDLPADLPDVLGRSMPLEQVLTQVLSNACDAYEAGKTPVADRKILLSARLAGPAVALAVQDYAGGIPAEHLPRIFEPFYTTKAVGKGTGLGLSSSYGMMREMDGAISAENHDGGARFTLLMPTA